MARQIRFVGSYRYCGDRVLVIGTFHRACPEHGGDLDIHAVRLEVVAPGFEKKYPLDRARLVRVLILSCAAGAAYALGSYRRRKAQEGGPR